MRLPWIPLLAIAFVALPAFSQDATGFVIVVHESNPLVSLTNPEASALFLKRQKEWPDGSEVSPVDRNPESAIRKSFTREVHGKDISAVRSYWQRLIFSGVDIPPPAFSSDDDIVSYVGAEPTAIGYVSEGTRLSDRVKIVELNDED